MDFWLVLGIMFGILVLLGLCFALLIPTISNDVKSWLQDVNLNSHLSDDIITKAQQHKPDHRTTKEQVEHWATIGYLAEQNPHMTITDIKNTLLDKDMGG